MSDKKEGIGTLSKLLDFMLAVFVAYTLIVVGANLVRPYVGLMLAVFGVLTVVLLVVRRARYW